MKPFVFFNVFLALLLAFSTANAQDTKGDALPEVKLMNLKGEEVNLSALAKGNKLTVISFWATWCSPCKKELSNIAELYKNWKQDYGVEVVAISTDDARNKDRVKSYVNGVNWPFTILLDPNEDMKRALNFQSIPYTLLIDRNGKILYRHNSYVEGDEFILEEKIVKESK